RRRELLTDHAQRQELVSLQAQDRLQPLHVAVGKQPVAALRSPRREQPLVLEVADLRDRDVRELRLQHPADGLDRQPSVFRGRRHQRFRNVSRYLPICSSSPSSSSAASTRLRLTNVPFRLPWSSIVNVPFLFVSTACLRDTVTSSRKIPQSGERPIVVWSASALNVSPALPPPERTTSAGPLIARSSSAASGEPSPSSGVNVCVVSVPASSLTSNAPQREQ